MYLLQFFFFNDTATTEIYTLSLHDALPISEFTIENVDKTDRGSDIILYIDDDCKEFLEESRISSLLKKYCSFLPIPIAFGKKKEWKDGKQVETAEDNIINDTARSEGAHV